MSFPSEQSKDQKTQSALTQGNSLTTNNKLSEENSPIVRALARHFSTWRDIDVKREVKDLKEVFESENHTVNIK